MIRYFVIAKLTVSRSHAGPDPNHTFPAHDPKFFDEVVMKAFNGSLDATFGKRAQLDSHEYTY